LPRTPPIRCMTEPIHSQGLLRAKARFDVLPPWRFRLMTGVGRCDVLRHALAIAPACSGP
ncbi:hypothetical protein ACLFKT_46830, partial [Paraburkholderia sp. BR14261]